MSKKILAFVLAFALVFSTMTVAFADTTTTISADAQITANLGVLKGTTGTVDAAYTATKPSRLQAAIMFLRLKGLEADALAFTGTTNFSDANQVNWAGGKAVMAYLKANPELGWIGNAGKFDPSALVTTQQYYKVMLEAIGYKQDVDFTYANVMTFAAGKGLVKNAAVTNFTVNDLAVATVEALKATVKEGGKTLAAKLVEAGKINKDAAKAAGLYTETTPVTAAIDTVEAVGNTTVEVTFKTDVDASAGNKANYAIEGLTINSATVVDTDRVRLETAAMTTGKLYTLTVNGKNVVFSGIAKVADGPQITGVASQDVEEVVVTFDRNIDFATGSNVANYSIAGVQIAKAEVDGKDVTLTTVGLKNRTKYTVKVTNIKSIDLVSRKTVSGDFTTNVDTTAPKVTAIEVQTNDRIKVTFNEKVTKASAENLANYTIKEDKTNGAALDINSITWNTDDENSVLIVTEPMTKRVDYKLSMVNVADQRKVANVITRPLTATFTSIAEDTTAPAFSNVEVLSPTTIIVTFTDGSKINEESALDLNNYTLKDLNIESIQTVQNDWKTFRALLTVEEMETGKSYDLTIADVQDEYGNTMKETTKTAKALVGSLASAKLLTAVANSENKITLTFDKEVNEATAENIANYSIDEAVGTPTKATLKTGGKIVELEVNDLIDGYDQYDLVVNGVKDLAGNSLYFKKKVDTTTVWNTVAPKLESAEALNKYVVALGFDERVTFEADAQLALAEMAADGSVAQYVYLDAKDYSDNNTVVEFSSAGALDPDKTYSVAKIVYNAKANDGGIKDLVGNRTLESSIKFGDFEFDGSSSDPDKAEVVSYDQVNGTDFEVTMSRNVDVIDNSVTVNGVTFAITSDDDVVTFAGNKALTEDADYTFDLSTILEDKHGYVAANNDSDTETILTGKDTDTVTPEIDSVVAKDRETIKITFSENIPAGTVAAADFVLRNYDLDSAVAITGVVDSTVGDNVIELTLGKALESRYEYELTLKDGQVKDFANNTNDGDATFYFNGTNLAH